MNGPERPMYLAFAVMAIMLACMKLWFLAAMALGCVGLVFLGLRDFQDPEDW